PLRGDRHAQRGRDRGGGMADAEAVVFALLAPRARRQAVLLLDRGDALATSCADSTGAPRPTPGDRAGYRTRGAGPRSARPRPGPRRSARQSWLPPRSGTGAARRPPPAVRHRARGADPPASRSAPDGGSG